MNRMQNSAFSLVELSIVLVILGLLTGGILTGQSLIKAAELRSVTTEYNQFVTAVNTFKGKYFALPGDINNATDFWGTKSSCPAAQYSAPPPAYEQETCNGNNDGIIEEADCTGCERYEQILFWQHLSNAGLVGGNYTGVSRSNSTGHRKHHAGINCPISKIDGGSCWGATTVVNGNGRTHGSFFASYSANVLYLGKPNPNSGGGGAMPHSPTDPVITPEDMWNIDTKMDDGLPETGQVSIITTNGVNNTGDCYHMVGTRNEYDVSQTASECAPVFAW